MPFTATGAPPCSEILSRPWFVGCQIVPALTTTRARCGVAGVGDRRRRRRGRPGHEPAHLAAGRSLGAHPQRALAARQIGGALAGGDRPGGRSLQVDDPARLLVVERPRVTVERRHALELARLELRGYRGHGRQGRRVGLLRVVLGGRRRLRRRPRIRLTCSRRRRPRRSRRSGRSRPTISIRLRPPPAAGHWKVSPAPGGPAAAAAGATVPCPPAAAGTGLERLTLERGGRLHGRRWRWRRRWWGRRGRLAQVGLVACARLLGGRRRCARQTAPASAGSGRRSAGSGSGSRASRRQRGPSRR